MFCGKCGAEVPDGYEFCMKCGAKIEPTQEADIETPKKKSKKWIIPVVAVIIVAIIAVVAVYFIKDMQKKSGLYNNIAWETSFEDIKSMLDKNNGDEEVSTADDKSLAYEIIDTYKEDKDVSAIVIYDCEDDDTLHSIQLFITNGEDSKYTDSKLYDKYAKEFTDLYGDSEEDTLGEKWTTKKSEITLSYMSDGMLIVDYKDINSVDED